MNFLVHLIYTTIFSKMLNLSDTNLFLAFFFGTVIDIDHMFRYFPALFKNKKIIQKETYLKTFLQEPIFVPVILLICLVLKTLIPLFFFAIHLLLDYSFSSVNRPYSPLINKEYTGLFNFRSKTYWLFTAVSVILFIVFFSFAENLDYLINIFQPVIS
ncbi:hypothetical protein GF327_06120 [Candidatus Woesearchaeota archaeon]|nr:hypothetical protein [Candidatus Woesearchaeota archaeon]